MNYVVVVVSRSLLDLDTVPFFRISSTFYFNCKEGHSMYYLYIVDFFKLTLIHHSRQFSFHSLLLFLPFHFQYLLFSLQHKTVCGKLLSLSNIIAITDLAIPEYA